MSSEKSSNTSKDSKTSKTSNTSNTSNTSKTPNNSNNSNTSSTSQLVKSTKANTALQPMQNSKPGGAKTRKQSRDKSQLATAIVSLIFAFALLGLLVVVARGFETKRLSCQSSIGDIYIEYDDQNVTGYTASATFEFDLSGQREYAERVGLEPYLTEFAIWFAENTDGTCHR